MRHGVWAPIPSAVFNPRTGGWVRKWVAGRAIRTRVVVLHRMEGHLEGSDSWLRGPFSGSACTHFGIGIWNGAVQTRQWVDTVNTAYGWSASPSDSPSSTALGILGDLMARVPWWPFWVSRIDLNYAAIHVEIEGWADEPWQPRFTRPLQLLLADIAGTHGGTVRLVGHTDCSIKPCPGVAQIPWNLFGGHGGMIRPSVPDTATNGGLPVRWNAIRKKGIVQKGSKLRIEPRLNAPIIRTFDQDEERYIDGATQGDAWEGDRTWVSWWIERPSDDNYDGQWGYVHRSGVVL